MGKVIVVTSGKGGVGKTTSTAAIGAALAHAGQLVCVVDFDIGLRNLDLIMGVEDRVSADLVDVARGDAKLTKALIRYRDIESLFLLPASHNRNVCDLRAESVRGILELLKTFFDWVLCGAL